MGQPSTGYESAIVSVDSWVATNLVGGDCRGCVILFLVEEGDDTNKYLWVLTVYWTPF